MDLEGYAATDVVPWEAASGDRGVACARAACSAAFTYTEAPARRDIIVQYFDVNTGRARYRVTAGGRVIAEWAAEDRLPTRKLDGSSSTRFVIPAVALEPGDRIRIEGIPDGEETAALDYVELAPAEAR